MKPPQSIMSNCCIISFVLKSLTQGGSKIWCFRTSDAAADGQISSDVKRGKPINTVPGSVLGNFT